MRVKFCLSSKMLSALRQLAKSRSLKWGGVYFGWFILACVLSQLKIKEAITLVKNVDSLTCLIAFSLVYLQNELSVRKWHRLLEKLEMPVELYKVRQVVLQANLTNLLMPSSLVGDAQKHLLMRSYLTDSPQAKIFWKRILLSQILDRATVWLIWAIISCLGIPLLFYFMPAFRAQTEFVLLALIVFFLAGVCLFVVCRKHSKTFGRLLFDPLVLCQSLFIALVIPAKILLCAYALGLALKTWPFILLMPVVLASYLLPFTGQAWGARELVMVNFSATIGLSTNQALSVSLLSGLVLTGASFLGFFASYAQRLGPLHSPKLVIRRSDIFLPVLFILVSLLVAKGFAALWLWSLGFIHICMLFKHQKADENVFNIANLITLGRLLILGIASIKGFSLDVLAFVFLLLLILDGCDGFIARQLHCTSSWGARFDMEVDALTILVAACLLVALKGFPLWVLMLGLWRYFFALWRTLCYGEVLLERRSRGGRLIFLVTFLALLIAFLTSHAAVLALLSMALLLLSWSFIEDIKFVIVNGVIS